MLTDCTQLILTKPFVLCLPGLPLVWFSEHLLFVTMPCLASQNQDAVLKLGAVVKSVQMMKS